MNDRPHIHRHATSGAPTVVSVPAPSAPAPYAGTVRHSIANIAVNAASTNQAHAGVIQALGGEIFKSKFVVEAEHGHVYFIPASDQGRIADGTSVSFDLADANMVANLQAVKATSAEQRTEQAPNVTVQVSAKGCAIEVVRMLHQIVTGEALSRAASREIFEYFDAYDAALGADVASIPKVLATSFAEYARTRDWRFIPPKIEYRNLSISKLRTSAPAIAILANPNHVVVVDQVTGEFPNRDVHYRDPERATYVVATETKFAERATGAYFVLL